MLFNPSYPTVIDFSLMLGPLDAAIGHDLLSNESKTCCSDHDSVVPVNWSHKRADRLAVDGIRHADTHTETEHPMQLMLSGNGNAARREHRSTCVISADFCLVRFS